MEFNNLELVCIHEDKVKNAQKFIQSYSANEILNIFAKICDETKVKIILALLEEDEMCVCDMSVLLGMSVASTSHHLRLLLKNNVLDKTRDGKMFYYFIKDEDIRSFFKFNLEELSVKGSV